MTMMISTPPTSAENCAGCGSRVTGEHMMAMGKKWHLVQLRKILTYVFRTTSVALTVTLKSEVTFMSTMDSQNAEPALKPNTTAANAACQSVVNTLLEMEKCCTLTALIVTNALDVVCKLMLLLVNCVLWTSIGTLNASFVPVRKCHYFSNNY